MARIVSKFIFVSITKPAAVWSQLGPHQLKGITGYEAAHRLEIRGFIEGLRAVSRLAGTPMWFTCGLPNEAGPDHSCWTSVDDDDAQFSWTDLWDEE
jgi:hypothetical protein